MCKKKCCIENCENECETSRRYCREHYLQRKREQAKVRYMLQNKTDRYYKHICSVCGSEFETWRKKTIGVCNNCMIETKRMIDQNINSKEYKTSSSSGLDAWQHRVMAKQFYGADIPDGYVVHHVDCDKTNNSPSNLVLMTLQDHSRFHYYSTVEYAKRMRSENMTYFEFMKMFFEEYICNNNITVIRFV